MKFEEALRLLRGGKRMRRPLWDRNDFIEYRDGKLMCEIDEPVGMLGQTDLFADDWEEYVEGHDFQWALVRLAAGKKVKRTFWDGRCYIQAPGPNHFVNWFDETGKHNDIPFTLDDFDGNDWVLGE